MKPVTRCIGNLSNCDLPCIDELKLDIVSDVNVDTISRNVIKKLPCLPFCDPPEYVHVAGPVEPHVDEAFADAMFLSIVLHAESHMLGSIDRVKRGRGQTADKIDTVWLTRGDVIVIDPARMHWVNASMPTHKLVLVQWTIPRRRINAAIEAFENFYEDTLA